MFIDSAIFLDMYFNDWIVYLSKFNVDNW
jgi:hypothetical protein